MVERVRFLHRGPARRTVLAAAILASVLVIASREVAGAFWGTSYLVLGAATVSAAAIVDRVGVLGSLGAAWRRRAGLIASLLLVQPALWGAVALADHWVPGTRITWALAVIAGTWHLPLIAVFSLLPLLAIAEIGATTTRGRVAAVGLALTCATATFALFFSDFDPFAAQPLLVWEHGESVVVVSNLLFLGTVLLGPVSALVHALQAGSETTPSMARLALTSLVGVAIVMLCGALGAQTDFGVVVLFVGLDAAVGVVAIGTLHVLAHAGDAAPEPAVRIDRLSERESEVLGLVAAGLTNAGIANQLFVSERTVDAHLRSIFAKLELPEGPLVNRRVHAALVWSEALHQHPLTPD